MILFLNEFTNVKYSLWDHVLYLWDSYLSRRVEDVDELFFCLIKYLRPNLMGLHHINIAFDQMSVWNAVCALKLYSCMTISLFLICPRRF